MAAVRSTQIDDMSLEQNHRIESAMHESFVPAISMASGSDGKIQVSAMGIADTESKREVTSDTIFWACSLSKPVFAYLVKKLIDDGTLNKSFLDEPLWDENELGPQEKRNPLTARMILSHQTGLPNEGPAEFKFDPGTGFRYSGEGYLFLQRKIKEQTGYDLEGLAQTRIFGPLGMSRSSFLFPTEEKNLAKTHNEAMEPNPLPKISANDNNAAGSLHTTAADYARFLMACLNDKEFLKLIVPQIHSMDKDIDSKEKNLDKAVLDRIDWGLGFGLQKNENGEVVAAFHWGHGPGARTFFVIDFNPPLSEEKLNGTPDITKSSVKVFFTNSDNGLALTENLIQDSESVKSIMKFLSAKYNYEKSNSPGWKEYHENLIAGSVAEKKNDFSSAVSFYEEAEKFRPENALLQYRIEWATTQMKIQKSTHSVSREQLQELEGNYGPVKIFADKSTLQIDVGNGKRDLIAIDQNTFLDGQVILHFDRDKLGNVSSLLCQFPNGGKPSFSPEAAEISAKEMAKSAFGQGSNTAKMLAKNKTSTANLLGGVLAHKTKGSKEKPPLIAYHGSESLLKSKGQQSAVIAPETQTTEVKKSIYKTPTLKPPGYHKG
jgi:CubicO group peptidase (beta-lactamase class C family)